MESKYRVSPRHGPTLPAAASTSPLAASTAHPPASAFDWRDDSPPPETRPLAGHRVVIWHQRAPASGTTLGGALPPAQRDALQAGRRASPALDDLCALAEGRLTRAELAARGLQGAVIPRLLRQVAQCLGGPAISGRDLHLLLSGLGQWLEHRLVLGALLQGLGGDAIPPERLRQVLDARVALLPVPLPDGDRHERECVLLLAHLQQCGALGGARQRPVLQHLLLAPGPLRHHARALDHLAPRHVLDARARAAWEADLGSAVAVAAQLPTNEMDSAFQRLAWALARAPGPLDLLVPLWRAAARCWALLPPHRRGLMAFAISRAYIPRDGLVGRDLRITRPLPPLLEAAELPGGRAMLPLACLLVFKDWLGAQYRLRVPPPLNEIRQALSGRPRSLQLVAWLAWYHAASDPGVELEADPPAPDEAPGLDTPRPITAALCRALLADPLAALHHEELEGAERFEALAAACALRSATGLADPDLERLAPGPLRDAVLLRLPTIMPWGMTAPRLAELHDGFMKRIEGDPDWMGRELPITAADAEAAMPAAEGAAGDTGWRASHEEVLCFYESFLPAYGLSLSGGELFPYTPPAQAWRRAAELAVVLQQLVTRSDAPAPPGEYERGRLTNFAAILARLRPLVSDPPELDLRIAKALAESDADRIEGAFFALCQLHVLDEPDPARKLRHVLARCVEAFRVRRWDMDPLLRGLLHPFREWPPSRSEALLRDGVMPPLLQLDPMDLAGAKPALDALGRGCLTRLDAALDPSLSLARPQRLRWVRALLGEAHMEGPGLFEAMQIRIACANFSDDPWVARELESLLR